MPVEGLEPEQVISILVANLVSTVYLKSNAASCTHTHTHPLVKEKV